MIVIKNQNIEKKGGLTGCPRGIPHQTAGEPIRRTPIAFRSLETVSEIGLNEPNGRVLKAIRS